MMMQLPPPRLEPFIVILAELAEPLVLGQGRAGLRRIIPIIGGRVEGRLRGKILDIGADWQTIFPDGTAELDARYAIETDDGALIDVRNFGVRHGPPEILARIALGETVDPTRYYMRTWPRFETGDPRYAWINRGLFVATGARGKNDVRIEVYEII